MYSQWFGGKNKSEVGLDGLARLPVSLELHLRAVNPIQPLALDQLVNEPARDSREPLLRLHGSSAPGKRSRQLSVQQADTSPIERHPPTPASQEQGGTGKTKLTCSCD